MTEQLAWMIRHIMQHHLGSMLQYKDERLVLQKHLALNDEEMEALDEFVGLVSSHLLERLVKDPTDHLDRPPFAQYS